MRGHDGGPSTGVGILARLSAAIMAVLALILIPMGAAGAQEAYPPDAIVNLIDPFGCAPTGISGGIGKVQPGSTLTGTLSISGVQVDQSTATVPASGNARYSVVVPPNTFGPAVVTASGTNTAGQPFTLETTGTIAPCPRRCRRPAAPAPARGSPLAWRRSSPAASWSLSVLAADVVRQEREGHVRAPSQRRGPRL